MDRGDVTASTRSGPAWSSSADLTQAARRRPRVCPECGRLFPPLEPGVPFVVEHCPDDGFAIVAQEHFERADGDPMLGRIIAARYTVLAKVGNGSMGAVYQAWQDPMARFVALKIMRYDRANNAEAKARFEREARAMSQLVSPHTVTVFDFGQAEDGSVYLAMELLRGESLGTRLRRVKRVSAFEAIGFVSQALTSLSEAHALGIIHRDLKPDNLFIAHVPAPLGTGMTEVIKVLDFGIAKVLTEETKIDTLETQAGTVFGTPRYMSPEQAQGKALDARSDLYALGVILYQMLCGRPPFDDADAVVVMARHIKAIPERPTEVCPDAAIPAELERIVMRALAKDPVDRPASAEMFMRALDLVVRDRLSQPPEARSGAIPVPVNGPLSTVAPSVLRTRRRLLLGALMVLLGATAAAAWLARPRLRSVDSESRVVSLGTHAYPTEGSAVPVVVQGTRADADTATSTPLPVELLPVAEKQSGWHAAKGQAFSRVRPGPPSGAAKPRSSTDPGEKTPSQSASPPGSSGAPARRYERFD